MEKTLNHKKFAQRIQEIMDLHQLNATAFAEKMDIGRATISHLMAGRNKPSLDFVMKVISTFPEVSLEWLLYRKDTPQKILSPTTNNDNHFKTKFKDQKDDIKDREMDSKIALETLQKPNEILEKKSSSKSSIKRIIIFFEDGTFENYEMK